MTDLFTPPEPTEALTPAQRAEQHRKRDGLLAIRRIRTELTDESDRANEGERE